MLDLSDKTSPVPIHFNARVDEASQVPAVLPVVGKMYRHYKGGLYRVTGLCTIEATLEVGVRYRALDPHARQDEWLRPLSDFFGSVGSMTRFTEVYEPTADALHRALPESLISLELRERILARYDEQGRFYHARWHIYDLFERAENANIPLSPEQALAILFHDVVYICGVPEGVNEKLSALLLRDMADKLGPFDLEQATRIIQDTAAHKPSLPESAVVLDLDLATLTDDPVRFCVTNELVWLENRHLLSDTPDPRRDFDTRRLKFLLNMAERGALFQTSFLPNAEDRARENLEGLRQAWVHKYSK